MLIAKIILLNIKIRLGTHPSLITWNTLSASFLGYGYSYIDGTVLSLTPNEAGSFSAVNFTGHFHGFSFGPSPFGATTSSEIFTDKYDNPDPTRVAGDGIWFSGSAAIDDSGVGAGGYQFGEMSGTNKNPSGISGWDLGVDLLVGGIILDGNVYDSSSSSNLDSFFESVGYSDLDSDFSSNDWYSWDYNGDSDNDWGDWSGSGYDDYGSDWYY
ncbi:MAG: hypothetical protein GY857_17575 [Desulfobacula sp.]|nr:hypothetical protein [Desulfobacula sp.]